MRRISGPSFRQSGAYTSPGTPEYDDHLPKTWSSERVPLPTSSSKRHVTAAALIPFNSGRAVPSKWDDAERWITSPVSGYGAFNAAAAQPDRRPKSKSGPLVPMGLAYWPNQSPTIQLHEGGNVRNFVANSPLTTGVFVPEGLSGHYEAAIAARFNSLCAEDASMPGLADMLSETSQPTSQDDKVDGRKEEEAAVILLRDMATQMSPEGSTHLSSKGSRSFSTTIHSSVPTLQRLHRNPAPAGKDDIRDVPTLQRLHRNPAPAGKDDIRDVPTLQSLHRNPAPAGKDDIRDVQIDKATNTSRGSAKQGVQDVPAAWNVTQLSKDMSKLQREEAKITAWENLQKAKAEAAVRKLEMKLEKKRSASMDKIANKLRDAQTKAQDMRNSLSSISDQPRISCSLYLKICNCLLCIKR